MICKHIFKRTWARVFWGVAHGGMVSSKYFSLTLVILFNTIHSFTHSQMVASIAMYYSQFKKRSIICLHLVKWPNSSI